MPQKRKASKARIENLNSARKTSPGKRRKSTAVESNLSDGDEGRTSNDEIVYLNSSKPPPKLIYNIPDGQQR